MKTPEIVSAQKVFEWFRLQKFQREHGEQEYTMIYEIDLPKIINKFLNDHPSFQPPVEEGEKQTDIFNEMFSLYFRLIHQEQMSEYDTVNDLKEKYTITRKP